MNEIKPIEVKQNEPVMTLRASDLVAPHAVRAYAAAYRAQCEHKNGGGPMDAEQRDVYNRTRELADAMDRWQMANGVQSW